MKRFSVLLVLLTVGSLLPGCPIYGGDDGGCLTTADCPSSYACDTAVGLCRPESDRRCDSPADCSGNLTCSRSGICLDGDCRWADVGCVRGYTCSSQTGAWRCAAVEGAGTAGQGGAASGGGEPNSSAGATSIGGTFASGGNQASAGDGNSGSSAGGLASAGAAATGGDSPLVSGAGGSI